MADPKKVFREYVRFSFETPTEKITVISVIVGEIIIGLLIIYAVLFGPLK